MANLNTIYLKILRLRKFICISSGYQISGTQLVLLGFILLWNFLSYVPYHCICTGRGIFVGIFEQEINFESCADLCSAKFIDWNHTKQVPKCNMLLCQGQFGIEEQNSEFIVFL